MICLITHVGFDYLYSTCNKMYIDLSTGNLKKRSWKGTKVIVQTKQSMVPIAQKKHLVGLLDQLKMRKRKFWYQQIHELRSRGRYFTRMLLIKKLKWTEELNQPGPWRSKSFLLTINSWLVIMSSSETVWGLMVLTQRDCSTGSLANKKEKRERGREKKLPTSRICKQERINKCVLPTFIILIFNVRILILWI